ncbi:MAG: alpha/beta hydrolase, partial [Candidatus Eremiobacterota bacterium]
GYWKVQGGFQKAAVAFHMHLSFPVLTRMFGYLPWRLLGSTDDLPLGVALEWARWCRSPGYLLDDPSLPLERYRRFTAPVLAYSFADDQWGTASAVDAMMRAYPNVQRRHVVPSQVGLRSIGHFGFFRPQAQSLWPDTLGWLREAVAAAR